MKISVVIPAYNEEKNIADTIQAVLAQDYNDFEVIVVNNASKDKTAEVASKFPVNLVHEQRKGLLWARECGRVNAKGDLIVNIDADCLPDSNWLSNGVRHFTDPSIVAVTGPYDYHDGDWLFRNVSLQIQKHLYHLMNSTIQFPYIKKGAVLIGGNNFIRSEVLKKTGGYNTALVFYGEDTDTAKRVSKYGKVKFDKNLQMKTSARRFKDEGTLNITIKYIYHFFKVIFS